MFQGFQGFKDLMGFKGFRGFKGLGFRVQGFDTLTHFKASKP